MSQLDVSREIGTAPQSQSIELGHSTLSPIEFNGVGYLVSLSVPGAFITFICATLLPVWGRRSRELVSTWIWAGRRHPATLPRSRCCAYAMRCSCGPALCRCLLLCRGGGLREGGRRTNGGWWIINLSHVRHIKRQIGYEKHHHRHGTVHTRRLVHHSVACYNCYQPLFPRVYWPDTSHPPPL